MQIYVIFFLKKENLLSLMLQRLRKPLVDVELLMYSVDTYVSKEGIGFKFNTANTAIVVGLAFLAGYAYCKYQQSANLA